MASRFILFTRYPAPGQAKTRLIPALSAVGAAALHRTLTERTVAAVRESGLSLQIRITGATIEMFTHWLGSGSLRAAR